MNWLDRLLCGSRPTLKPVKRSTITDWTLYCDLMAGRFGEEKRVVAAQIPFREFEAVLLEYLELETYGSLDVHFHIDDEVGNWAYRNLWHTDCPGLLTWDYIADSLALRRGRAENCRQYETGGL